MSQFQYSQIEQQLVEALPEIRPAAEFYWQTEGAAGKDSLPYVFLQELFATYIEVLLWVDPTPRRDELLRRAFAVSDQMFDSADQKVRELVAIGLFEGKRSGVAQASEAVRWAARGGVAKGISRVLAHLFERERRDSPEDPRRLSRPNDHRARAGAARNPSPWRNVRGRAPS